jgi:hypothetical protein
MPPSNEAVTLIAAALVTAPAEAGRVVVTALGVPLGGVGAVFVFVRDVRVFDVLVGDVGVTELLVEGFAVVEVLVTEGVVAEVSVVSVEVIKVVSDGINTVEELSDEEGVVGILVEEVDVTRVLSGFEAAAEVLSDCGCVVVVPWTGNGKLILVISVIDVVVIVVGEVLLYDIDVVEIP